MKKYMVFTQMVDKFDAVPRPPGDLMAIGKVRFGLPPLLSIARLCGCY